MATNHNPGAYLAFANLQMAAEAFLTSAVGDNDQLRVRLSAGNKYNSKFTETGATDFAAKFKVLAHTDNPGRIDGNNSGTVGSGSGFSGTLFENVKGAVVELNFKIAETRSHQSSQPYVEP